MKLKINAKVIKKLNPCKDRLDNYLKHYKDFNGDILEFLDLDEITAKDKIWVSVRLLPRDLVEVFAIDCALKANAYAANAAAYANAVYAADAADAYAAYYATADAYAANAAYYATAASLEDSVDALAYLIMGDIK